MMEKWIAEFPGQLREALRIGEESTLKKRLFYPSAVLVAGLGGSGIGAATVKEFYKREIKVPFLINQDYLLPGFVRESTLVIVSSFSGNTEESLAMMEEAIERGAEVAAVSSGGRVSEVCTENGLNLIKLPPGQPPRTCLGYSMTAQLFLLHHYGQISADFKAELSKTADFLEQQQENIRTKANEIAKKLHGRLPVLYSGTALEAVTLRFRQQLNENAKMLGWHNVLPEMNHNELVGWKDEEERLAVVFIRSDDDNKRTSKRIDFTMEIIQTKVKCAIEIIAEGTSKWERTFYLIHLCDWISYYLSEVRSVDPIQIEVIEKLKGALADFN